MNPGDLKLEILVAHLAQMPIRYRVSLMIREIKLGIDILAETNVERKLLAEKEFLREMDQKKYMMACEKYMLMQGLSVKGMALIR